MSQKIPCGGFQYDTNTLEMSNGVLRVVGAASMPTTEYVLRKAGFEAEPEISSINSSNGIEVDDSVNVTNIGIIEDDKGDVAHGIQSTTDIVLYGTGVDIVNGPLIMTSRDGVRFKITIDNTGRLVSQRIE